MAKHTRSGQVKREADSVTVTVPIRHPPQGTYLPEYLGVGGMTLQQRMALKSFTLGLQETHARTSDGKHVDTYAQAVKWLLENMRQVPKPS